MDKRQMVQIPAEQVKKLLELDKIRSDLVGYPVSKKVHILLQEKLADVFQSKSFFPHGDSILKGRWFEYIRDPLPPHIIAPFLFGSIEYSKEMIGIGFTQILMPYDGEKSWWCNLKEDIHRVGKFLARKLLEEKELALGLVDGRNTKLESVKELKGMIQRAGKVISKRKLWVSPNCGMEFLPHESAKKKLGLLREVANSI